MIRDCTFTRRIEMASPAAPGEVTPAALVASSPVISTSQRGRAIATVVSAFIDDPVVRWIYPDAAQYLRAFPRVVAAFARKAFDNGSAYTFRQPSAVALWLGPGVEPDTAALGEIMDTTVSKHLVEDLNGFFHQQLDVHPHEPHWYLPLIGVDPAYRGRGLGSALLKHALGISDRDGLPAYLEATSTDNRRLYERHGFEAVGEIQYRKSPTMWPMWREPR
jgi:ribosomal protein S18 acetylase RimI-like enzyme